MQIFIDTNVLLSFYHLTSEDLEELKKLCVLIKNKEVALLLPQQVIDETRRNRANKINDSFNPFKKHRFTISYPAYCKSYSEYESLREATKVCEAIHSELVSKIQADIQSNELAADNLLEELFSLARVIDCSDSLLQLARDRMDIGNPPGKRGSLGDAINWECLLKTASEYSDLYIIADDSDFASTLDSSQLNEFLQHEWKSKKNSHVIHFFRKLSSFFQEKYPDINLAAEAEKDKLITKLTQSPNFSATHAIIASLSQYNTFTNLQAENLISALNNNEQVRWIINDEDVLNFYSKVYDQHSFTMMLDLDDKLFKILSDNN